MRVELLSGCIDEPADSRDDDICNDETHRQDELMEEQHDGDDDGDEDHHVAWPEDFAIVLMTASRRGA